MTDDSATTPADRDAALASALDAHPGAFIGVAASSGLLAPLPDELRRTGLREIKGPTSALALVVEEDQRVVVEAWQAQRVTGWSSCPIRLLSDPGTEAHLHFFDTTHRFDLVTMLITGVTTLPGLTTHQEKPRPRLVTLDKDDAAKIVTADPQIELLLGWPASELVGRSALELVHPGDHVRAISSYMDMITAPPGAARRVRLRHLHRDGSVVWFEITNHNHLDEDPPRVFAEMLDISDEMAAQEALRASEQLLRRLAESLPLGVVQIDTAGRIVYRNTRFSLAVGTDGGEHVTDLLSLVVPGDRPMVEQTIAEVLQTGRDADIEYGYRHTERGLRRVQAHLRALFDEQEVVTGAVLSVSDITEDVVLREQLHRQATYDTLTGCLNRAATMTALTGYHTAPATAGRGVAVIFLDLNEFKQVNDRYGHSTGDRLLVHVAERIRGTVRADDLVGRLGGDEFVVICRDIADPAHARRVGESLIAALADGGIQAGDELVRPAASIGAAWSARLPDAETIIARADAAMYTAKKDRGERLVLAMAD